MRRDIQGLRAIAVLAVIADHLLGWPHGGFVGVDVFFVISGFLITGLLLREYDDRQHISFLRFYERRAKRILPAALLVILVTVCLTYAVFGFGRAKTVIQDAIPSALFTANWHFARLGTDYFQQGKPPSPLQHYWSLAVEEQFYFVWPWLLLGLLFVATRLRRSAPVNTRAIAGTAVGVISVVSLAWAFHLTAAKPTAAYFATATRAWELGVGALLAISAGRLQLPDARWRTVAQYVGLAAIAVALVVTPESGGFPAPWALLPVLATAVVILAGNDLADRAPGLLTNPVSQYVGLISYSLYLWHFPVVVLLLAVFAPGTAPYMLVGLVLVFGLAALSFRYVENPARRATWLPRRQDGRRRLPGVWVRSAVAVAVAVVAAGLVLVGTTAVAPPKAQGATVVMGHTDDRPADCFGAAAADPRHDCALNDPDGGVAPLPADLANDQGVAYRCYTKLGAALESCTYGSDAPDALKVAWVGDSHAASLFAGLAPQLEAANWRVDTFLGNGCRLREPADDADGCAEARPQILARVESGDYDVVVATATRATTLTSSQLVGELARLRAKGQPVVVVEDAPDVSIDAYYCTTRIGDALGRRCETPRDVALAQADPLAAAAREAGVPVVDLTDVYCDDSVCPSVIGNVLVYRDTAGHMSATWARTIAPYVMEGVAAAIRPDPA